MNAWTQSGGEGGVMKRGCLGYSIPYTHVFIAWTKLPCLKSQYNGLGSEVQQTRDEILSPSLRDGRKSTVSVHIYASYANLPQDLLNDLKEACFSPWYHYPQNTQAFQSSHTITFTPPGCSKTAEPEQLLPTNQTPANSLMPWSSNHSPRW